MSWHFEILIVNARRFVDGQSYERRDPYASVVTIQFKNQKTAYLSGLWNDEMQGEIGRSDWRELRDKLRQQFGVELLTGEHKKEPLAIPTGPAPLA